MGILDRDALARMGFARIGSNVRLSDRASFYNCPGISIGDHVRIDDFCVLSAGSGGIDIGSYIHIAVYSSLMGRGVITLADFCNISSRVSIYSSNDDYSGEWMSNPTVSDAYTGVTHADVTIGRHAIVGSGTVILPGSKLEDGTAIGALSLVKGRCEEFGIYAGVPLRRIGTRKRRLLELEERFLAESQNNQN
ncbi:MAG TPA: acyltransferase [Terracidiphilus sp.]|nr:acyltransferase [Terracidiphilus sp.]